MLTIMLTCPPAGVPMFTIWRNGAENAKTVLMKSRVYEGIAAEDKVPPPPRALSPNGPWYATPNP